ncbi:hypothetical protein ESB00_11415 [Oleiharenicola lentus]|jgi:uncharacterized membrane-anchored protein|uniref:GDYXXLXY domain-containing protein n=1 Tax=Oleiharenicola lentus TaxID=2508720 RepID=A0A4Q1CC05_9BACT|nr:GDYXXLXY domain-containing protein [Oleiharenicola lentus]RXK56442.1 hypothetical protein ESB00_11415 [Oleiharenicola lentus]
MKLKLVITVAVLQVLVLAFMAGQREWIMHTGTPLTLRTAPIDPNDPMRGAYVRLNYDISVVPAALCRGETAKWVKFTGDWRQQRRLHDRVVYAALKINEHGIAELVALSDQPPASGPFLRGRVVSVDHDDIRVRYGIEAMFMSKEAALRTESMAIKERAGAPMAVSVAVGGNGTAVLKNFAWEPLGLTITLQRPPTESRDPTRPSQQIQRPINAVIATLHNYGDKNLAIVDLPGGRSFRLVPNALMNHNRFVWAPPADFAVPAPRAENIIVLKPGESLAIQIDLTDRDWWIRDITKPEIPPAAMSQRDNWDWNASFRLEYVPPSADAVRGLTNADLIRHAPLRSRAFSAMQGID